jgi:twitching motility protein PilT
MAQIDQLIGFMTGQHAERVVLINDQPMTIFVDGQQKPGTVVSGATLQNLLGDITPPHLRAQLAQDGGFSFPYHCAQGDFVIKVGRSGATTQLAIMPASASNGDSGGASNGTSNGISLDGLNNASSTTGAASYASETTASAPAVAKAPAGTKMISHIDELFRLMKEVEASDLHLSAGEAPIMRVQGRIDRLPEYGIQSGEDVKRALYPITPERNRVEFEAGGDTDFAYEIDGVARFRCNLFQDRKGMGGVFRLIPSDVLTAQQLKLEPAILELCNLSKGLVVVTGPTGSGKSTTLAAMIDFINKQRDDHIITIEDPVEFVHKNIKCLVNQREVHVHTASFKRALKAALREDPDIVLVGEMRDLETIAIAIETAETGHLVFGTLHTTTGAVNG